ncbi:hypothetical protein HBI12_092360 [Parastagonospora nodorum]|nr:hypothetical protein HBI12_092360 [Parastagonospora nodorum]
MPLPSNIEDIHAAGFRREAGDRDSRSRSQSLASPSGLLNIINGAALQEGRVLVMTTNHPDSLDSALIRPGRVDVQVKFTLATSEQIRDMYKRMYTDTSSTKTSSIKPLEVLQLGTHDSKARLDSFDVVLYITGSRNVEPEQLNKMAEVFAARLPANTFSPAEIQEFLLKRKTGPESALIDVEIWRDKLKVRKAR